MTWHYFQKNGWIDKDGILVSKEGYSGAGEGKNNPEMEHVHNVGPIPAGKWTISGPPRDTPEHGPYVLRLTAHKDTITFGRSGFLIHGDSVHAPGTASQGCIILPRPAREKVYQSGDTELEVLSGIDKEEI